MERVPDTETRIFEAAKEAFFEHGFDGARMADIAGRAGINQSMLHYYFRSKEQLFEAVFRKAVSEVIPPVVAGLRGDGPILERIERFVHQYIDTIVVNPHLPAFVLQELRRNPDALRRLIGSTTGGVFDGLKDDIQAAAERVEIRSVDPAHLLTNVLALCIFPFIARPMLQTVFHLDDSAFAGFVSDRKREATDFIRNALRP